MTSTREMLCGPRMLGIRITVFPVSLVAFSRWGDGDRHDISYFLASLGWRNGEGETVSGTCEKMYFEERGVGTMVGEYVTFVGW